MFLSIPIFLKAQSRKEKSFNSKRKSNSILSCTNNWLEVKDDQSAFQIGDLDVTGHEITVEALFNRTSISPRLDSVTNGKGEIVSKHTDPTNANYILRADRAQVTTTNGHFVASASCALPLYKTYHVALVYNGVELKFYRNGFLLSSVPCTGDLITNDLVALVGNFAYNPGEYKDALKGYINEVRIWNVARSQDHIRTYMNSTLPNPTTQNGLLAYYTFDDLKNKQGNSQWDGHLLNNAQINQMNPTCSSFVADSCNVIVTPILSTNVIAGFTAPDTVCVNTPINLSNTSLGATSNYWSFCSTDLNTATPEAVNVGNLNGGISFPVFMDLVHDGNNYYGFLVDHYPGSLIRLDFGNSYLNIPTVTNLGNFNGIIPPKYGAEGIQIVKNNGKWYAIIVGGSVMNNEVPRIIKIDFGTNITNTSPVATNWGNIGNLSFPTDLYVFYESGNWYGYTANSESSTITRFNFGSDFDQTPTGENLGGFNGVFNYPTGLYPINDDGNWHLFVTNAYGNNLVRLDFGTSLLNTANATDLGNLGSVLNSPRDISIMKSCNSLIGYLVNGSPSVQELIKLDFHNNVSGTPTATSLGNNGSYSFPHSISKLFRVGNDLYSFVANVYNNTITRLKFSGCNSSNIANFEGVTPPQISYNTPGIYNILLSVDEGLPTQTTYCKQIVVLAKPQHLPNKDTSFCESQSLKLARSYSNVTYLWNTGSTDSSIVITTPGKYWVQFNKGFDCTSADTFNVIGSSHIVLNLGADTGLCAKQSLLLNATNAGSTYLWQDGSTQSTYNVTKGGNYSVKVTSVSGCSVSDSIHIADYASPLVTSISDKTICAGDSIQLIVSATGNDNVFLWRYATTLSDTTVNNPIAFPKDTTQYFVNIRNANKCVTKDSITVAVVAKPIIKTIGDTSICNHSSVVLQSTIQHADNIQWQPSISLTSTIIESPSASPNHPITYIVTALNKGCQTKDTVNVNVIMTKVFAGNDTTVCGASSLQLNAFGGVRYQWFPGTGLSDPNISNPIAYLANGITYKVIGTDMYGCSDTDSIKIRSLPKPVFAISTTDTTICKGSTILVSATGGNSYNWKPSETVQQPLEGSGVITPNTSAIYTVNITDTVCNITGEEQINITVLPSPIVSAVKSNDITCSKDSAILLASGGIHYTWSPTSGLSNPNDSLTLATPEKNMNYTVKVMSENGCTATDSIQLFVVTGGKNKYGIPSAFTPNNDGLNDCFGVGNWKYIKLFDFSIYDRWGSLLFHTNKTSDCWDGNYKGNKEPNGSYVYKIHAETDCSIVEKVNTFVLIR